MRFALVASVALAAAAGMAHADPEQQHAADKLFEQGRELLLDRKDPAGACQKFDQAIALDPLAAGTMLNLGLCHEQLGHFRSALYWFRKAQLRATETTPPLPDYEHAAREHIAALVHKVATIRLAFAGGEPQGAVVKIDGEQIRREDYSQVEIDPGVHQLSAGAPGRKLFHRELEVVGHGGQTLSLELPAGDDAIVIDRGRDKRRLGLLVGAGGAVMLASASILIAVEAHTYGQNETAAKQGNPTALAATRDAASLVRWVGTPLVLGGLAALGIGGYLYVRAPAKERVERTVLAPTVGPSHLGLAVSGRF